ncbi:hypothetical protein JAAARDRAFT_126094 [Jaapia argillacea MUCL 33604]|uniref:Uncharacterized protein n=1 Tax=Jaapia argillacea MUCL 33604 TaxID=933084 RepID=A0A067Q2Z3_9AGAM|nr:hypothetical protein JAAARDRAFT_126094 [Jaapia argillacea MUCL 33604]
MLILLSPRLYSLLLCLSCLVTALLYKTGNSSLGVTLRVETRLLTDPDQPGMHRMVIGCVFLFFSFVFQGVQYLCALVHWLVPIVKDDDTGMCVV